MAKADSAPTAELITDKARAFIAMDATCEIEELAMLLSRELSERGEAGNLAMIGIARRIKALNSIVMSAISDERETTESLAERYP